MSESDSVYNVISSALGNLDHQTPMSPGIFENAMDMLTNIGCKAAAVYVVDDYPDAMRVIARSDDGRYFPDFVGLEDPANPDIELATVIGPMPGLKTFKLYSHGRTLGALAVNAKGIGVKGERTLSGIVRIFSVLAYIEIIRNNCQRERTEREIFFAQALANRLMLRTPPKTEFYRLGFERLRALELGGDFFDFVPAKDGRVFAFLGRCSGTGLKTALEMVEIMHHIDRSFVGTISLSEIVANVNTHLVEIKNRTHLASLCIMEFDPYAGKMRMVRAGNFAVAVCHSGHIHSISRDSELFLGMINDLAMEEEEFEFKPGSALICATEGIFNLRNRLDQSLPAQIFDDSIKEARREKSMKSLINCAFDRIRSVSEYTLAQDSIAAISVEFLNKP